MSSTDRPALEPVSYLSLHQHPAGRTQLAYNLLQAGKRAIYAAIACAPQHRDWLDDDAYGLTIAEIAGSIANATSAKLLAEIERGPSLQCPHAVVVSTGLGLALEAAVARHAAGVMPAIWIEAEANALAHLSAQDALATLAAQPAHIAQIVTCATDLHLAEAELLQDLR
jgi:hypothetical protein